MDGNQSRRAERCALAIASWLCLAGGVTLAGAMVLVPPWLDVGRLEAQWDLLARQAEAIERQLDGLEKVGAAIRSNDPVVLEYLAFHYMGKKPSGTALLSNHDWPPTSGPFDPQQRWPVPTAGERVVTNEVLSRWTQGRRRLILAGVSCLCLLTGLWLAPARER